MAAAQGINLVTAGSFGAAALGLVIGGGMSLQVQWSAIPDEGVRGPSSLAIHSAAASAVLRFLTGVPIDPMDDDTASTVTLSTELHDKTVIDNEMATCKAGSHNLNIDRDSPVGGGAHGAYDQEFVHQGAMATSPFSA